MKSHDKFIPTPTAFDSLGFVDTEFSEFDKTGLIEDHHQIGSFNWDFVPDKYLLQNGAGYYAQHNPKHLDEQGNETTHYPVSNHNSPYAHRMYADYILEAVNSRSL